RKFANGIDECVDLSLGLFYRRAESAFYRVVIIGIQLGNPIFTLDGQYDDIGRECVETALCVYYFLAELRKPGLINIDFEPIREPVGDERCVKELRREGRKQRHFGGSQVESIARCLLQLMPNEIPFSSS